MIKVHVTLSNHFDAISDSLNIKGKARITNKVASDVAELAREMAPVDTGNLRASIRVERDGNNHAVVTDVSYAPFLEFGTSRAPAQPFLGPAAESVRLDRFDLEAAIR